MDEKTQDPPALLTVREVSHFLRFSEAGVRKLAKRGDLPATKIGGSLRFRRDVIERVSGARFTAASQRATR